MSGRPGLRTRSGGYEVPIDRQIVALVTEVLFQRSADQDFSLALGLIIDLGGSQDAIGELVVLAVNCLERLAILEDRDALELLREARPPQF